MICSAFGDAHLAPGKAGSHEPANGRHWRKLKSVLTSAATTCTAIAKPSQTRHLPSVLIRRRVTAIEILMQVTAQHQNRMAKVFSRRSVGSSFWSKCWMCRPRPLCVDATKMAHSIAEKICGTDVLESVVQDRSSGKGTHGRDDDEHVVPPGESNYVKSDMEAEGEEKE
jgi:hypothetical protein